MLEKLKNHKATDRVMVYIKSLNDIRNVGLLIFLIIVLLVTWSGVRVVQDNYDWQKKISVLKQQNEIKQMENANLALRNKYLETDEYLELVARKQYNKALPGETMLIVPKAVALKHAVDNPVVEEPKIESIEGTGSKYERNFNAWLDFLFR
ncbi:septum formation initiator family protein [Candidatus Saccharibacteria bacterium]|nr:septum formation initiator family protein [Candidatus Saccharibacteria bacterium]